MHINLYTLNINLHISLYICVYLNTCTDTSKNISNFFNVCLHTNQHSCVSKYIYTCVRTIPYFFKTGDSAKHKATLSPNKLKTGTKPLITLIVNK